MNSGTLEILGPIGVRRFALEHECEESVLHKHNYDHVTILRRGECFAQVIGEEPWYLGMHPINDKDQGVYRCAGLWLRRVNVFPDNPLEDEITRTWTLLQMQGSIRVFATYNRRADGVETEHRFAAGENGVLNPGISVRITADAPAQLMLLSAVLPDDPQDAQTDWGGDFVFIAAGKKHRIKAETKDCAYNCCFPHRDFSGVVVESYEAARNMEAYS